MTANPHPLQASADLYLRLRNGWRPLVDRIDMAEAEESALTELTLRYVWDVAVLAHVPAEARENAHVNNAYLRRALDVLGEQLDPAEAEVLAGLRLRGFRPLAEAKRDAKALPAPSAEVSP